MCPSRTIPWYRGFCRVKFDRNKAPAFTRLIAQAWKQGKEDYGRKHNATNWKLRVMNLIKKHKLDVYGDIGVNRWSNGMLEGQFSVYFENGECVDFYANWRRNP